MKTLINKFTTAASGAVLFAAAIAMAGLGFAVIASLAIFAFFAVGVALVAAPFARAALEDEELAAGEKVSA